jgi:hypothetical protein
VYLRAVTDTLGHKKLSLTLEHYTHSSPEMQMAAAGMISRRLPGVAPDATTSEDQSTKKRVVSRTDLRTRATNGPNPPD